jgi:hypothetical protein
MDIATAYTSKFGLAIPKFKKFIDLTIGGDLPGDITADIAPVKYQYK